ncbi:MAG: LEPR-XLL domain-containing protein, partial [Nevskiales bacterium]
MSFYHRLVAGVSHAAMLASLPHPPTARPPRRSKLRRERQAPNLQRLERSPLAFETLEPRILLSSVDPTSAAALLQGLTAFQTWTHDHLDQYAQLAQKLPVISSSAGDLVDLPDYIQTDLITPAQAYFTGTAQAQWTIEGLASAIAGALGADATAQIGSVIGQFADGELMVTLAQLQTKTAISQALNLSEDSGGISLHIGSPPTLSGTGAASLSLVFGYDTVNSTFFVKPMVLTETVHAAASGFSATATLGAADASVINASATLDAIATVTLVDPVKNDPLGYISQASLTGAPLSSLVSATLTGSADLTLPISSSLVPGGPQTLKLDWSGDLSAVGSNNLAAIGDWAQLDTIAPALLQKAIASLPGLLQSAAGASAFAGTLPVIGGELGQVFGFGQQIADAVTATSGATSLNDVANVLQTALGHAVTFQVNHANNDLEFTVLATGNFDTTLPFNLNETVAGSGLTLN